MPPYGLNDFPEGVLRSVAKSFIAKVVLCGEDAYPDIHGMELEQMFARAIGGEWHRSRNGLDDVRLNDCAWAVKSVKRSHPDNVDSVRLISGRNSLDYSYNISDVRSMEPEDVGKLVIAIWNDRVSEALAAYKELRTVVILRSDDLQRAVLFEVPTETYDHKHYKWVWNRNGNLVAHLKNEKCFTWQPHGAQFTIHLKLPEVRHLIELEIPNSQPMIQRDDVLELVGFREEWVRLRRLSRTENNG